MHSYETLVNETLDPGMFAVVFVKSIPTFSPWELMFFRKSFFGWGRHSNAQIETVIYRKRKRCILPLFGEVVLLFILVWILVSVAKFFLLFNGFAISMQDLINEGLLWVSRYPASGRKSWDVARFEDNKDTFVLAKATIDRELSYIGAID